MASACVNNVGISPETFLDRSPAKFPSYGWLSPRKSCSNKVDKPTEKQSSSKVEKPEEADRGDDVEELGDFEFCLEDNFTMLPADELFLNGKLVPLQLSMAKHAVASSEHASGTSSSRVMTNPLSRNEISIMDPYLFSPKAPRCTTRWKELLGLRKLYQKEKEKEKEKDNNSKSSLSISTTSASPSSKSIKSLLNRSSRSSMTSSLDSSVSLPLLKDSENEYISISSSRLSLSSSSSSHEHDDLPRLSLDADNKPGSARVLFGNHHTRSGARVVKPKRHTQSSSSENPAIGVRARSTMRRQTDPNQEPRLISADSPRMNASGKIVFHNLERSSSSPSSYGGPRYKHSGVQRSYSANVRVTPVLNVPVCSLRGSGAGGGVFGLFGSSTQPKRDSFGSVTGSSSSKGGSNNQSSKHRKDRN